MPLIYALLGGLATAMSSMVGRVLLALGLSYVTFSGYDLAVNWLLDQIKADINSMPVEVASFLGYLWIDRAVSMIFSAYTVALGIKMAGSTTITKMVQKGPGA